jgi:hypothetical protein
LNVDDLKGETIQWNRLHNSCWNSNQIRSTADTEKKKTIFIAVERGAKIFVSSTAAKPVVMTSGSNSQEMKWINYLW